MREAVCGVLALALHVGVAWLIHRPSMPLEVKPQWIWLSVPPSGPNPPVQSSTAAVGAAGPLGSKPASPGGDGGEGAGDAVFGALMAAGNRPPRYPREALDREWEGLVELHVRFGPRGQAVSVEVVRTSGYGILDEAATEAARNWRYEGGGGAGVRVPVRFVLSDEG